MGSANGIFIDHTLLSQGNGHRLRSSDRISLDLEGDKEDKGDKEEILSMMCSEISA